MAGVVPTKAKGPKVLTPWGESVSDCYGTPGKFFRELDNEFQFSLDAAATKENAKCPLFYTVADDALSRPWTDGAPGAVWVNPPYSRGKIPKWLEKASVESEEQRRVVVVLTISDTSTKWFHEYREIASEVRFIQGRLRYIDPVTGQCKTPSFGSLLFVFDPGEYF